MNNIAYNNLMNLFALLPFLLPSLFTYCSIEVSIFYLLTISSFKLLFTSFIHTYPFIIYFCIHSIYSI